VTASASDPPPAVPAADDPIGGLRLALAEAGASLRADGADPGARLERPPRPEFGDFSSNAPMLLAPVLGASPREVAERLGAIVADRLGPSLERAEVAGPGFLNLFLSDAWYRDALARALAAGPAFGRGGAAQVGRERILVEFVSANPTGPLTVASGRHAAYGDALCRLLAFAGHEVEREYYVNDHGGQIRRFGESIGARARGEEPPEGGYHGAYVEALARALPDAASADPERLAREGVERMVAAVRTTLARFRVDFDRFFSERGLHEDGAVERAIERLGERDQVYASEGATWLRSSERGDDKDRVLRRSTGEATYFAADVAYHADKLARGFDRAVNVLGADHHGYVARVAAAWEALGGDAERLELLIMQLVNLLEHGQRVQMSKREGEFVTLDDLMDDIGVDAARFFLLQRSHDTTLDLDLTLAREQSQENPVYYVQYAHARIAGILDRAGEERVAAALRADLAHSPEVPHPSARVLLGRLLEFPSEVGVAVDRRAPHRMTVYAQEVAAGFSAFYRDCRVVGAAEEGGDEDFRLAVCVQARRVIARALDLLGVEAPERM
jgi:arginyl-tRNA synthetase